LLAPDAFGEPGVVRDRMRTMAYFVKHFLLSTPREHVARKGSPGSKAGYIFDVLQRRYL